MSDRGMLDHVNLHLVDNMEEANNFKRWLGQRRDVLGVDTETGSLKPHSGPLRLIQFGDMTDGWAIPWYRWGGVAEEALRDYEGDLVLHNSKFDVGFITYNMPWLKWPWYRTNDTMSMAHILDPLRPKGLKPLAGLHVDRKAVAAQQVLTQGMAQNKWDWASVPIDYMPYWVYAAMDPVLTCFLFDKFKHGVTQFSDTYHLELGVLQVITDMERRGAYVDVEYCRRTRGELKEYARQARSWCHDAAGLQDVGSNTQVVRTFERLGCDFTVYTPKGAKSASKYQLQLFGLEGGVVGDLANTILGIRQAEKRADSYLLNFIDGADEHGCVHPSIWTQGTKTARMSVTEPALQTLPRGDAIVRDAFTSRMGEDGRIITCDYSQIEARLMTHFSRDDGLVRAFMSDQDFFVALARTIYADDGIGKKSPLRQLVKNTVYGKLYGAGVAKMAETAGVPFEQMEPVVKMFDQTYPGVKVFQGSVTHTGNQRLKTEGLAYVTTPYGRRLVAEPDKVYTLVNYLIQCHAAEILKRKLIEMDSVGLGDYMVLPVHDEVILDVPASEADDVQRTLQETMQDLTTYAVPLTVEAEVLDRWGTKYRKAA